MQYTRLPTAVMYLQISGSWRVQDFSNHSADVYQKGASHFVIWKLHSAFKHSGDGYEIRHSMRMYYTSILTSVESIVRVPATS